MNLGSLAMEPDIILSNSCLAPEFDLKDQDEFSGLPAVAEEEIVSSVAFNPSPAPSVREKRPAAPRTPFWNFLEDHRYAKSPRAFPVFKPPPESRKGRTAEPSSSFESKGDAALLNGRRSNVGGSRHLQSARSKLMSPLNSLSSAFSSFSNLPATSGSSMFGGAFLPSFMSSSSAGQTYGAVNAFDGDDDADEYDGSRFVFKDVDALDMVGDRRRREKKSFTGKSRKYNLGNGIPLSRSNEDIDGGKAEVFDDVNTIDPADGSVTPSRDDVFVAAPRFEIIHEAVSFEKLPEDPGERKKEVKKKKKKKEKKEKNTVAYHDDGRSSSSGGILGRNSFVWDTLPLKGRGKEARERSKAEENARKEKKLMLLKTPAVLKKARAKAVSTTKMDSLSFSDLSMRKLSKTKKSFLASMSALTPAGKKKQEKENKKKLAAEAFTSKTTADPVPANKATPASKVTPKTKNAKSVSASNVSASPGPSPVKKDAATAAAGLSRKRKSGPSDATANEEQKYFNKSFGAVSLDNVVGSTRRRSLSQSQRAAAEKEEPPAQPPPTSSRPVPPKKPKRKL